MFESVVTKKKQDRRRQAGAFGISLATWVGGALIGALLVNTLSSSPEQEEEVPEELAELMVGRKVLLRIEKQTIQTGQPVLSCSKLNYVDNKGVHRLKDISFTIKQG